MQLRMRLAFPAVRDMVEIWFITAQIPDTNRQLDQRQKSVSLRNPI